MHTEIFEIKKTEDTETILKSGDLSTLGASMVKGRGICHLYLFSRCVGVTMMVPTEVYETIKNDTHIIVESDGFWNRLTDKNVTVKRENGDIIKPVKHF